MLSVLHRLSIQHARIATTALMVAKRARKNQRQVISSVGVARVAEVEATMTVPIEVEDNRRVSSRIRAKKVVVPQADAESPLTELDEPETEPSPKKRRRKVKECEPIVYNILPVEAKTTTYKGAFLLFACATGLSCDLCARPARICEFATSINIHHSKIMQACLNTILRETKPEPTFCSRCVSMIVESRTTSLSYCFFTGPVDWLLLRKTALILQKILAYKMLEILANSYR